MPLTKTKEELQEFEQVIAYCKIGDYSHWSVHVDIKQYYLGRVFVWAKRYDAQELTDLTFEEREELFTVILKELLEMYKVAEFNPDLMNYASLGNEMHHCHMHVVPRYKTARIFKGEEFIDEHIGKNFSQGNRAHKTLSTQVMDDLVYHLRTSLKKVQEA